MKNIFFILLLCTLFSCKNKEAKMYELVTSYNEATKGKVTADLVQTKAFTLDKKNIAFDFIFKLKEDTLSVSTKNKVDALVAQIDKDYNLIKDLSKESVKFKIRIYNAYGIKIQELPLTVNTNGNLLVEM